MKQGSLQYYYIDLLTAFHTQFDNVLATQGPEDIHRLRIAMKKFRALFQLIQKAEKKEKNQTYFTVFSALFQASGKVRDIQVNRGLMEKYNASYIMPCRDHLWKVEQQAITRLLLVMRDFDFAALDHLSGVLLDTLQAIPDKSFQKISARFVFRKLNNVRKLKTHRRQTGKLHKIRIDLRDTIEVTGILQVLDPRIRVSAILKGVKKLHGRIGEWHDYLVLVHMLKTFIKEEADVAHLQRLIIFSKQLHRWNVKRGARICAQKDKYILSSSLKRLRKRA